MNVITVTRLSVDVEMGKATDDPHGQGFAAISATVETGDTAVVDQLERVHRERDTVTLRCAMLDVTGPITKVNTKRRTTEFVLSVRQLAYRDPYRSQSG
jgi:hypothetical protein